MRKQMSGEISNIDLTKINFPNVVIVILNWNGWEYTIECLESIFRIDYPNYQVIVVDNGSKNDLWGKIKVLSRDETVAESEFFVYNLNNKPTQAIDCNRTISEPGGFNELYNMSQFEEGSYANK